jgi:hypothetical protein
MAEVSGLGHSALMTTARNFLRAERIFSINRGTLHFSLNNAARLL